MANFAQLLKEEITRLSKKEVRTAIAPVLTAIQTLRKANAEQKKKLSELEHLFQKYASSLPEMQSSPDGKALSFDKKTRLGPGGIIRIRKRLGLDRHSMALLLGVNPNSIFLWEHGKNKPRPNMRERILSLRDLTRKDIQEQLKILPAKTPAPKARKKILEKGPEPAAAGKPAGSPEKKEFSKTISPEKLGREAV